MMVMMVMAVMVVMVVMVVLAVMVVIFQLIPPCLDDINNRVPKELPMFRPSKWIATSTLLWKTFLQIARTRLDLFLTKVF